MLITILEIDFNNLRIYFMLNFFFFYYLKHLKYKFLTAFKCVKY